MYLLARQQVHRAGPGAGQHEVTGADAGAEPRQVLVVRRSIADPTQIASFAVHAKAGTPIGEIVRVMGLRDQFAHPDSSVGQAGKRGGRQAVSKS